MTKTVICTALALVAFALNSIWCRLALGGGEADAVGFTVVRLFSGAIVLALLAVLSAKGSESIKKGSWASAVCLFGYAICFSLAYLGLTAATGALILFASVQIAMIVAAVAQGDRPAVLEWLGIVVALSGLVFLLSPGLTSPPLISALLMTTAGAAWAAYTIRGRKEGDDPLGINAGNFLRTIPLAIASSTLFLQNLRLTDRGILLAMISGAITSGIGYAIWYTALKGLTSTRAAVVQLAVPVITAAIGVGFLSEMVDERLFIAGSLILGGIILAIFGKQRLPKIV